MMMRERMGGQRGRATMTFTPDQTTDLRLREVERKLDRLKEVEQKLDRVLRALEGSKAPQPEGARALEPHPTAIPTPSPPKEDRE
jgi:hypothetical protein